MPGQTLPLRQRPFDWAYILFFLVNLILITYMIDVEQLVIANPDNFHYPLWPPKWIIDLMHWYGRTFDPLLIARPPWWRATIWIDALFFGPFYACAVYAFIKGKNWIRFGAIIWASVMLTNVTIILFEETVGTLASPQLMRVYLANLAWVVFPIAILVRMWKSTTPFSANAVAKS